ncbi:hypothetical protein EV702DRAFT_1270798 [Suillus placidus]|uniref:Uncharacterized protein n=1 Tax=Suillus placidus TaxID=48579 RepID=A0A9P6ZNV1_9AGAM|nr:hypothetical protein EV702DRAFT_1270798 [Suillus placidus]
MFHPKEVGVMDPTKAAWALNRATHAVKTMVPLEQRMVFIHIVSSTDFIPLKSELFTEGPLIKSLVWVAGRGVGAECDETRMVEYHHLLELSLVDMDMPAGCGTTQGHQNNVEIENLSERTTSSYVEQLAFESDRTAINDGNDEKQIEDELSGRYWGSAMNESPYRYAQQRDQI